jgi:hypothetical protein
MHLGVSSTLLESAKMEIVVCEQPTSADEHHSGSFNIISHLLQIFARRKGTTLQISVLSG